MNPKSAKRMYWVLAVLLLGLIGVAWRAYQLQVVLANEHLARADWSSQATVEVEAPRGQILDREGRVLAESVIAYTLAIDPQYFFRHEAGHRTAVIDALSRFDGFTLEQFEAWAGSDPATLTQYHVIARRVPPGEADEVLASLQRAGVRSVRAVPEYRRVYPYLHVAGHTLGAVQLDGAQGLSGVELAYDEHLRGDTVTYNVERDHARRAYVTGDVPEVEAATGGGVILSLDMNLQRYVEDVLLQTVEHYEAEAGVVVVSRPSTGEILAMASAPTFDPNRATTYPLSAYLNPAVANAYEPGSTAKIFTIAASMNEGFVDLDTPIDCEHGRTFVGGHWVEDTHHDDVIPAWRVIQVSSNVGALKIGMRMDQSTHREYLLDFGFGQLPGSGLPGETAGLLRQLPWYDIEHANMAFGHGFSVSPLQLNMATATIANGGMRMRPMLVLGLRDAEGNVIETFEPTEERQVISPEVARQVTRAMETVVEDEGTGTRAGVPGFRVAGKTGTAEIYNPRLRRYENAFLSSFTGFVPSDDPEFAITVMVLRPARWIGYYGGLVAAPLFRRVAEEALSINGVFPTEPLLDPNDASGLPEGSGEAPAEEPGDTDTDEDTTAREGGGALSSQSVAPPSDAEHLIPDLSGSRVADVYRFAAAHGLDVSVEGRGRVVSQAPAAGSAIEAGQTIEVVMQEDTP